MRSTLLSGPVHARLQQRAFEIADGSADGSLGSVLYIARNDARRDEVEDAWAARHRSLRLRAETLDAVVRDWYEQLAGPVAPLSGQPDRRLTEFALDGATAAEDGALDGEPASAALADAFSSRFSLFDDAGVLTAAELADAFAGSPLDDRIAATTVDAYRRYRELQREHVDDWVRSRGAVFDTVASADRSLATLSPSVDVVVVSGYHEFRPVERRVLERIAESFDTLALLPLHQSGDGGVDAVATDALELYDSLGFEREHVAPAPESRAIADVTNGLYRPEPVAPSGSARCGESTQPGGGLSVPPGLKWRELPTPEREVRYVARELRAELADGRDPDSLAVVVPGIDSYAGLVADAFETFGVPHAATAARELDRTLAGSALQDLLSLAEPEPRAEAFTSLLSNPLVDLVPDARADAVTAAARRRETVALKPLLAELDGELREVADELLAALEPLRSGSINSGVDAVRQLLSRRIGLADAVDDYAAGETRALERRAVEVVDDVLDSFEREGLESELTPLALLTRAFDGVPVRPPGTAGGRVEVMGLLDARMRAFERVLVVGLTSEQFPASPERPAFFEEMTDAHPRFATADERLRGRYLFATLLTNADEVTLTTPETGGDDDVAVRSPVLEELQRVTGIEPTEGVDDRVGSREDLQRGIAAHPDQRAAVDAAGERGDLSPGQTKRADRGLVCAANRSDATLTAHDAMLGPETVADVYPAAEREPYSASRIERYVECGFKFYAENVLGIEDPDPVERTPTPLETGRYAHDVFERFYADLQAGDEPVVLDEYDRETLERQLLEVASEELQAAAFDYEGLFYRRWLTELFAGLGEPGDNPYFGSEQPVGAGGFRHGVERGLFATFLDEELGSDGRGRPRWFEEPFGEGLGGSDAEPFAVETPSGGSVPIRGYIDRIDVGEAGGSSQVGEAAEAPKLTLYDYKTGRAPYLTKTTGGTTFQLPIYLLAADQAVSDQYLEGAELSATYYQVRPPNDVRVPRGLESKFDSQSELRRFLETVVPEWLETVDGAVAAGRFHTTLLSASGANCRYCDYRRSCDVRHHRKRERIDAAQADGSAYVPLRVEDRSLAEVMSDD